MEFARAAIAIFRRIEDSECCSIFFPEVGALPIRDAMSEYQSFNRPVFSSKVTASAKCPLHKQIIGVLTESERLARLLPEERRVFLETWKRLRESGLPSRSATQLACKTRQEIIEVIGDVGISVPTEVLRESFPNQVAFDHFRVKQIEQVICGFPSVSHAARPLLNVVLHRTRFARALRLGCVYVVDEAISRGRTLNTLEFIFKSYCAEARWKIGVLFAPKFTCRSDFLDFVYSHSLTSPFTNRFDLIGKIVVENKIAFACYSLIGLQRRLKKPSVRDADELLGRFLEDVRLFFRRDFSDLLRVNASGGVLEELDIEKLCLFWFASRDGDLIRSCLALNPLDTSAIVEEVDFYIHLPHPFLPIVFRHTHRDQLLEVLHRIEHPTAKRKASLDKLIRGFRKIRSTHEYQELKRWLSLRQNVWADVTKTLRQL